MAPETHLWVVVCYPWAQTLNLLGYLRVCNVELDIKFLVKCWIKYEIHEVIDLQTVESLKKKGKKCSLIEILTSNLFKCSKGWNFFFVLELSGSFCLTTQTGVEHFRNFSINLILLDKNIYFFLCAKLLFWIYSERQSSDSSTQQKILKKWNFDLWVSRNNLISSYFPNIVYYVLTTVQI